MNPEIKQRWIEALNSDEYKQTKECLRDSTGFCCLGVLTDLYVKEHNQDWSLSDNGYYSYNSLSSTLPFEVETWAGLDDFDPHFYTDNTKVYLSILNDAGYTFKEIAQIIEEKF